eukprot:scaffold201471_cov43-Tisochrysis_lutea.AAC.2
MDRPKWRTAPGAVVHAREGDCAHRLELLRAVHAEGEDGVGRGGGRGARGARARETEKWAKNRATRLKTRS